MSEPWKVIVCQTEECLAEALDENGKIKEEAKVHPKYDTESFTQFTCPRCGQSETWGVTRQKVAQTLYERIGNAGVGK